MNQNGNDRGHRLALILQALDENEKEFSRCKLDYKERKERLKSQLFTLREAIISGQEELPLEGM